MAGSSTKFHFPTIRPRRLLIVMAFALAVSGLMLSVRVEAQDNSAESNAATSQTPDQSSHNEIPDGAKHQPAPAPRLAPDRFREVDDAATVMIWLVTASGLGGLLMLVLIVVGARRMRRLTRSRSLQTQYDELEYLRIKHRKELEQLSRSDPPKRESRP